MFYLFYVQVDKSICGPDHFIVDPRGRPGERREG